MLTCLWCGESLKFELGRGWVHLDGELYRTKAIFTERYPEGVIVDDHCALPNYSGLPPLRKEA